MARQSTPDTYTCDVCGEGRGERGSRLHLEFEGPRTVAVDPNGYDFCSIKCLGNWAIAHESLS